MTENNSEPQAPSVSNPLEEALRKGQQGEMAQEDVILTFLNSNLIMLSEVDPEANPEENLAPLALGGPDGDPMIVVYSSPELVNEELAEKAPYGIAVQGATVVHSIGEGTGIMLNPGEELGFMVDPAGVEQIKQDFRPAAEVDALRQALAGQGAGQTAHDAPSAPAQDGVRASSDPASF